MARGLDGRHVSRCGCSCWSAYWQGELVDLRWRVEFELGEDVALGFGDLGALPEGASRTGEGADGDALELVEQLRPGVPVGGLGDAGQERGEPAEDDVGADAYFFAVVDRAQVDDPFHVAPAALDFEELLVARAMSLVGSLGSLVRSRYLLTIQDIVPCVMPGGSW
jgi:hypothetical protein